jgi:hypothetical protein
MEPEHNRFGGGVPDTLLHPLVAAVVLLIIILILCLRRRHVIFPLLLGLLFIPKGQVIVLLSLHFTMARILILAGLVRCVRFRPAVARTFNSIDRLFALLNLSLLLIFSVQWMEGRAFVKAFADFLDALGGYFLLRFLIRDTDDVRRALKSLAIVAIIMAVFMVNEQITGRNLFVFLGGVPQNVVRGGHVRSQGTFEVFITAGTFGATLAPLLVWLWSDARSRIVAFLGLVGASVMTITCYASTTLISYAAGVLALCIWPLRKRMQLLRVGLVAALVGLHLVMNGPVWSLIEKVDLTGSSTSYHRYMLIDNFIRHFGDWWLLGFRDYQNWGWDMWDLSNQYVANGLTGGLLSLALFIALIVLCFARLGTARKRVAGDHREEWFLWCLGSALFAHVVAYFGIGYFDQLQFSWYTLLAIISCATAASVQSRVNRPVQELAGDPLLPAAT